VRKEGERNVNRSAAVDGLQGGDSVSRVEHLSTNRRRFRGPRLALLCCALVAAGLLVTGGCARRGLAPRKVALLAIDGMDWSLIDPLLDEGRMPNLALLIERGARRDFRSLEPHQKSAVIWTTIATGKEPGKHGVTDFVKATGLSQLTGSYSWKARPVWDILGESGHTVGVVNWMVSWPAQPVNGYFVSDRIVYAPELGEGDTEGLTYPTELLGELAPLVRGHSETTDEELRVFLNGDSWRTSDDRVIRQSVEDLRTYYGRDESILALAKHLLTSREQPDLFAVYVRGLDKCCHSYWGAMDPSIPFIIITDEGIETFRDVIPRYYERIDAMIGEFVEALEDDTTIIVCSDHGFRGLCVGADGAVKCGYWMHRALGAFAAAGPGISESGDVREASVFDVAPTVLALFGEPIGRDMDGLVMREVVDEGFLRDHPVQYVDTYERGEVVEPEPETSPLDERIKEELRALGYIN
jgi:predicted AlkP superfamily phosphohydrolase/phosphomutase